MARPTNRSRRTERPQRTTPRLGAHASPPGRARRACGAAHAGGKSADRVRRKEVLATTATALLGHLARRAAACCRGNTHGSSPRCARVVAGGRSTLRRAAGDRRFADAAWSRERRVPAAVAGVRRALRFARPLRRRSEAWTATTAERARFVVSLFEDAIAPTNFLASNPAALRKLVDTKGTSVIRGLANFVEDLASGTWLPRQVDARPFTVGRNVAATPGAVVFRNELLELIQYAPTTPEVHERPLLIVPPQINKYYVFDLAPARSIVQWALEGGVRRLS